MKTYLQIALYLLIAGSLTAAESSPFRNRHKPRNHAASSDEVMDAQPKLLRISASVDGSGRMIVTRKTVRYEHRHWAPPSEVMFDGEPWENLLRTPPAWREMARHLDLSKAWIVKRQGRDVIALENTPNGFDLYLCDSPNGAADYEITIAIPRRK